ncbi:alpha/beta hydrolase [Alteromonas ponticola]|uniref:Alpha/beta hydrolase n=1 Tax=Alteromonas aquimaris TaxID=2998417 RepID=A0ABT3P7S5_9ALTE|nr:alpha/beta family hydrolase [Alteromonas aquimaris]MCW8108818.1 alpha/beta hydrolase [Alteromonas aquimaris]
MSFSIEMKKARSSPIARIILAHGAGAGKSSDFMQTIANEIAQRDVEVLLFDFPYMQRIQQTGTRRPPDKMPLLETHFHEIITQSMQNQNSMPTFIGGKSMGGRVATLIADKCRIKGGVVFGYPFHPPGKPEKTRTSHLADLQTPFLILQGERDPFGTADEIKQYSLSQSIQTSIVGDGDHSFKPRKASGLSLEDNLQTAIEKTIHFIKERCIA